MSGTSSSRIRRTALGLVAVTAITASPLVAQSPPLAPLFILEPTGATRDGLPVLALTPNSGATLAVLERGFSGRLLRLYAMEQEFLHRKTGRLPEAAYLLLSDHQGGFPRIGFYLGDEKKADAGWVDLHRGSRLSGQFGAMDQIFPHELMHVIMRQLAGPARESGGNQVHAIGVRTDPVTAFAEGFAEAMQILAIDDPEAAGDTHRLQGDAETRARAERNIEAFSRDVSAEWWRVQPSRLRFLFWFSQSEQVLRYHAVKANRFARIPPISEPLLARDDKYLAYLIANVVPGRPNDAVKPAGVLLSTEGVVSFCFWRFASDTAIQRRYEPDAFYRQFGASAATVVPIENVFLKIFAALDGGHPSTAAELLRAYARMFPADTADVDRVVSEALMGQPLPDAPEIWLANDALMTGSSLFDQYRAQPRPHTFDVNAATALDWLSVPGVTREQASALLAAAPYRRLDDVLASPTMSDRLRRQVTTMAAAMQRLRERAADEEQSLSLWAIARAYLWRLGVIIAATSFAGAWLARRAGARRAWSAALLGIAASALVIVFAWVIVSPVWIPFVAPIILGGLPWSLWRLARRRPMTSSVRPLAVWLAASTPALVVILATAR